MEKVLKIENFCSTYGTEKNKKIIFSTNVITDPIYGIKPQLFYSAFFRVFLPDNYAPNYRIIGRSEVGLCMLWNSLKAKIVLRR